MNLLLAGGYIPKGVLITIIALSIVIIGAIAINLVFIMKIKKTGKANETNISEPVGQVYIPQTENAVEKIKTEIVEETYVAEETVVTENQETSIVFQDGREIIARFNRSFSAKLIQSPEETKEFYCIIRNYLLSFKGVKSRISWKADTFNIGRRQIAKLMVKGKTLNVNLALNPADYVDAKFRVVDKTESKIYANVPLGYKIKSNRAVKNAMKLIDEVVKALGLEKWENGEIVSASDFPYENTKTLMGKNLIKVKSVSGEEITDIDKVVSQPFTIHERITVEEAHAEITDEVAMTLVVEGSGNKAVGKKYAVNIDVL